MTPRIPGLPPVWVCLKQTTSRISVSVLLSFLALSVSITSAYFSWFRVSRALDVVVTDLDNTSETFRVTFAAINKGNRAETLVGARLVLGDPRRGQKWNQFEFASVPLHNVAGKVIEPGKVIIETIEWPALMLCLAGDVVGSDPKYERSFIRTYVGLRVRALADNGEVWDSVHAIGALSAREDGVDVCFAIRYGFRPRTFSALENKVEDYLAFPFLDHPKPTD